ncbi:hypothetical protein ENBRE01_2972, partial [Enteropsectra breve]
MPLMSWLRVEELFLLLKANRITKIEDLLVFYQADWEGIVVCSKCNRQMKKSPRSSSTFSLFRCSKCDTSKKLNKIKCLLETNYSIIVVLRVLCCFALNISNNIISEMLELDRTTVNSIILQLQGDI